MGNVVNIYTYCLTTSDALFTIGILHYHTSRAHFRNALNSPYCFESFEKKYLSKDEMQKN